MAHRCVTDRDGTRWDVWEVIPSAVQDHVGHLVPQAPTVGMKRDNRIIVADNLQAGWLAFQCEHEKREQITS